MEDKQTAIALITGCNKGLGYETARRLIDMGYTAYIGSRNEARGIAAAKKLGAELVLIDVTEDHSVKGAAAYMADREGRIDILINNAGVSGVFKNRKISQAATWNACLNRMYSGLSA